MKFFLLLSALLAVSLAEEPIVMRGVFARVPLERPVKVESFMEEIVQDGSNVDAAKGAVEALQTSLANLKIEAAQIKEQIKTATPEIAELLTLKLAGTEAQLENGMALLSNSLRAVIGRKFRNVQENEISEIHV